MNWIVSCADSISGSKLKTPTLPETGRISYPKKAKPVTRRCCTEAVSSKTEGPSTEKAQKDWPPAGWIGRLGGAQRRRWRAKNRQVLTQIKNCSSFGYPSAQIEAF